MVKRVLANHYTQENVCVCVCVCVCVGVCVCKYIWIYVVSGKIPPFTNKSCLEDFEHSSHEHSAEVCTLQYL